MALIAQGTVFQRGNGANPEVFSSVAELADIGGPSASRGSIDVTSLSSQAREFVPGLVDWGDITIGGNLVPDDAAQRAIRGDLAITNAPPRNWKLIYPDNTTAAFAGFVTSYETSAAVEDKLTVSIGIKITGAVTWTP